MADKKHLRNIIIAVVVLGIVGVLLILLMMPKIISVSRHWHVDGTFDDIGAFNSALKLYRVDTNHGPFPATLMQLVSDNANGWAGPYLATIAKDPWGNDYIYTGSADNYTILSVHDAYYVGGARTSTIRYILNEGGHSDAVIKEIYDDQ